MQRIRNGEPLSHPTSRVVWSPKLIRKEESLWSIVNTFLYINMLTKKEFKDFAGLNRGTSVQVNLLDGTVMVNGTGRREHDLKEFALNALSIKNFSSRVLFKGSEKHPLLDYEFNKIRYCPICLKQGFHSIAYQSRVLEHCPIHQAPLIDKCVVCGSQIPVNIRLQVNQLAYHCESCKTFFADQFQMLNPPEPLTDHRCLYPFWMQRMTARKLLKLNSAMIIASGYQLKGPEQSIGFPVLRDFFQRTFFEKCANIEESYLQPIRVFNSPRKKRLPSLVLKRAWRILVKKYHKRIEETLKLELSDDGLQQAFHFFSKNVDEFSRLATKNNEPEWMVLLNPPSSLEFDVRLYPKTLRFHNFSAHKILQREAYKQYVISLAIECLIAGHYASTLSKGSCNYLRSDFRLFFLPTILFIEKQSKVLKYTLEYEFNVEPIKEHIKEIVLKRDFIMPDLFSFLNR